MSTGDLRPLTVQFQGLVVVEHKEIGEPLALRRQQRGPDSVSRGSGGDVV